MPEKQKLSITEQENMAEAVLRIVAAYPDYPKTITDSNIRLDDLEGKSECIGVFPISGAVVLKEYIYGGFDAEYPFLLLYKCQPTTNRAVIEKRGVFDKLAMWLESIEYPDLSDGREIQSIKRTSTTILTEKAKDGMSVFQCTFKLNYSKD